MYATYVCQNDIGAPKMQNHVSALMIFNIFKTIAISFPFLFAFAFKNKQEWHFAIDGRVKGSNTESKQLANAQNAILV